METDDKRWRDKEKEESQSIVKRKMEERCEEISVSSKALVNKRSVYASPEQRKTEIKPE